MHPREISASIGIGWRPFGSGRLFFRKRGVPSLHARAIHEPLSEHGTQPGRQAAPAVEIAEERLALSALVCQPEEIGIG
jgi:hypothetical protein